MSSPSVSILCVMMLGGSDICIATRYTEESAGHFLAVLSDYTARHTIFSCSVRTLVAGFDCAHGSPSSLNRTCNDQLQHFRVCCRGCAYKLIRAPSRYSLNVVPAFTVVNATGQSRCHLGPSRNTGASDHQIVEVLQLSSGRSLATKRILWQPAVAATISMKTVRHSIRCIDQKAPQHAWALLARVQDC